MSPQSKYKRNSYLLFIVVYVYIFNCFGQISVDLEKISKFHRLSSNRVTSIVKVHNGYIWLGTEARLNRYDDEQQNVFNRQNGSISSNNMIYIFLDKKHGIWIAASGRRLNSYNQLEDKFIIYKSDPEDEKSIPSSQINTLFEDSRRNLWTGALGGGSNSFHKETEVLNRFEGYGNSRYQTITDIVEAHSENIWFNTKNGIHQYDCIAGSYTRFPTLSVEHHINSAFKRKRDVLYFEGAKGVACLNPKMIVHENVQPLARINNFKLFNEAVSIGEREILTHNIAFTDQGILKHSLNVMMFEFAAIQFPFSPKCEYVIPMEPFGRNWRAIGTDRTARYINFPSGNYTIRVKRRRLGRDRGKSIRSLKAKVLKPSWFTWLTFGIYGLSVILILYVFKYIITQEKLKTNLQLDRITYEKDIELYNLKHQFFTNISHEIRTPVTLILGSINRLLEKKSLDSEAQVNSINAIKKNGNKLLKLVNELLDFRKLNQREIRLSVTKGNLVTFCKEVYLSFTEMALQKGIEFKFNTSSPDIDVWFDKNQLEKVLYNLLSNAFKFTNEKGTVYFTITERADKIQIEIEDQGIGIPSNQLSKIFTRFYQTNDVDCTVEKGFGLGLCIAKQVIDLHHGEIIVESEKGKGSIFKILLLKGHAHFKEDQLKKDGDNSDGIENYFVSYSDTIKNKELLLDQNTKKAKKQTLLIVEDNKEIRNYIISLLSNEFNILEAVDGSEGLKLAYNETPDLIISDVLMPIMGGIEFTRELKSNIRTSHIPILLLTARASFAHKIGGYDVGADDYITKPFNEDLLRSRIRGVLRNRQRLHEKFWSKELIPISELELNKADQDFMNRLIEIIESNMKIKDLSAKFICDSLGMSHSVVYKKIKGLTNMTYVQFVREFKLKTAKKLIEEQNFSILDACYHVGYSDRKYFSKLFKNHFGKVPSAYLKTKE